MGDQNSTPIPGAARPAPSDLRLLSFADIEQLVEAPRVPILGGWLTERHPCLVYAQTGRGKSLFCMSLAIAIAGGGEVFGWKADEPRRVLYIDAEMDVADIKERQSLLAQTVGSISETALKENLFVLSRHVQEQGAIFPDLVQEEGRQALREIVQEVSPEVVILDNLSTMADLRDENDAAAFTPVLETLWQLRQLGCAVILVHHTGKQEGKYRGSSKLATTFESILQLARNDDLLPGDTGFHLRVDKFRGANLPKPMKVSLKMDDEGAASWEVSGGEDRQLAKLVQLVMSRNYGTQNEIAEEMGVEKGTISKWKRKAIAAGLITIAEFNQCLSDARRFLSEEPEVSDEDVFGGGVH